MTWMQFGIAAIPCWLLIVAAGEALTKEKK